jgi:hypothetical protein
MKFLALFHIALVILFATLNGIMLYLFMLQLPYGVDPFLFSLASWDQLSPQIVVVASVCALLAVGGALLAQKLSPDWKNRLLYMRWQFPHPSQDAFLTVRKQPFESQALLAAYPMVKDSGFSRQVQVETWHKAYEEHATLPVVLNTRLHWDMLRDIYVLSLFFLVLFLLAWLINIGVPFQIVSIYVFLYGAQTLFLMFTARKVGVRLVDNVLGVSLGLKEEKKQPLGRKKKK